MNKNCRFIWNEAACAKRAARENSLEQSRSARARRAAGVRATSIALAIAALTAAAPSLASSIANADCTPANSGSGSWSNVAGCGADAGAPKAAHNLAETVYGANGIVPQNISYASIFGFAGQVRAYYGTAIGAAAYVNGSAQNSVAIGTGSVASEANTVSLGRVGDNPLKGVYTDNGDGTSADATGFNQGLAGTLTRRLTNMSAGINNTDAVNVGQLKAAGVTVDPSGNVTNAFVAYDDTTRGKVTLGGGTAGTTLANLKPGAVSAASSEAINGSQLYGSASSVAAALGGGSVVNADGSIRMPRYTVGGDVVSGVDGAVDALDTRITNVSDATADLAAKARYIKFGQTVAQDATASGADSVAIGGFAQALGDGALAIGANARALAFNSVAIGAGSSANQANTFAVGSNTSKRRIVNVADAASASDAVTLGQMTAAISAALPPGNLKSGAMPGAAVALAAPAPASVLAATAAAVDAPQVGAATDNLAFDSAAHDRLTLGGADSATRVALSNLQDATLTDISTDAVTGAQLYAANQQIASLGLAVQNFTANGSAEVAANTTSGPAIATGTNSFASGGGANASGNGATALGDRAQASATGSLALGSQANASGSNAVALGANAVATRDNSVSVGAPGGERQIVNVAAGVEGNDAVNVNQLNASVANTGQQVAGLQNQINSVAKGANAGTAAAMAVAGLPQPTQAGKTMVAVSGARYGGQTGTAFGASYVTQNNRFVVKVSGNTSTNGNVGVVAGAGFQW
jgi:trimeric autotransporter adhesin